jgi:hypothetical protein
MTQELEEIEDFVNKLNELDIEFTQLVSEYPSSSIISHFFNTSVISFDNENPNGKYKTIYWQSGTWANNYLRVCLVEDCNNKYILALNDQDLISELSFDFKIDYLKYIGRKTPKIVSSMIESQYQYNDLSLCDIPIYYNNFMDLKGILKGKSNNELFNMITNIGLKSKIIEIITSKSEDHADINFLIRNVNEETLSDLIVHLKEEIQIQQFIHNVSSIKHRHFFTKKARNYIKDLIRSEVTESEFRNDFSNKISKYKEIESFELSLKKYIEIKSGWGKESWLKKLQSLQLQPEEIAPGVFMTQITDYDVLSQIGSPQWCITTNNFYFYKYTENLQRQYMVLDFNVSSNNPYSMIGVTANVDGDIIFAHDKNDESIMDIISLNIASKILPLSTITIVNQLSLIYKNSKDLFKSFCYFGIKDSHMDNLKEKLKQEILLKNKKDNTLNVYSTLNDIIFLICDISNKNNIGESFKLVNDILAENTELKLSGIDYITFSTYLDRDQTDSSLNVFHNNMFKLSIDEQADIIFHLFDSANNQDKLCKILTSFIQQHGNKIWKCKGSSKYINDHILVNNLCENDSLFKIFTKTDIPQQIFYKALISHGDKPFVKEYYLSLEDYKQKSLKINLLKNNESDLLKKLHDI